MSLLHEVLSLRTGSCLCVCVSARATSGEHQLQCPGYLQMLRSVFTSRGLQPPSLATQRLCYCRVVASRCQVTSTNEQRTFHTRQVSLCSDSKRVPSESKSSVSAVL